MEGRRVERRAPRRNPLYVMFLCLVAAVFVLLLVVIVLGAKYGAAQKEAESTAKQIEELQARLEELEKQKPVTTEPDDEKLDGEDTPAVDPSTVPDSTQTSGRTDKTDKTDRNEQTSKKLVVDWLDLTGHSELTILPEKLFNDYATYYTSEGVNLRSGPSTSYDRVELIERGSKVKAAAKDGDWTFVSFDGKFGWIHSDYLATTPPVEGSSGSLLQLTN